jgi:haloacetate dehalogenase
MSEEYFEGFASLDVDSGEARIHVRRGGRGPAVLLLHGFPETHLMWRHVAPDLARDLTVVAADLRGYGASSAPDGSDDHAAYAKRAMARDMVAVMRHLGFARFSVVGHDRGARVAYRLALDHPDVVERLAVLDIVPTAHAWRAADMRFALGFWPWSLLAQPAPFPERLIASAPALFVDHALDSWSATPDAARIAFPAAIRAAYRAPLTRPEIVHAICEEYRAAATLDLAHDEADLAAGRRIRCPVLALWSRTGTVEEWYDDPLAVWRRWADHVQGRAMDGGHFLPEEQPEMTTAALREFLVGGSPSGKR